MHGHPQYVYELSTLIVHTLVNDVANNTNASLGPVDYLYVYIYSWEFMGSMDKCPDY